MSGSVPKAIKAPPVPDPEAIPDMTSTEEAKDQAKKKVFRGGRGQTFLTGNLAPESTGKKTLLG